MCERAAVRGSGQARDLGGAGFWYHQGRMSGVSQFKRENKFDTFQYFDPWRELPSPLSLQLFP